MERDQLLERAALLEIRVVEAPDHDVGDVLEAVGAQEVLRGGRRERRERVVALDRPVGQPPLPFAPRTSGPRSSERTSSQPMCGCERRAGIEPRMARVDLLERQPARLLHQVDQPEVARSEHDDVLVPDFLLGLLLLLRLPADRLADRMADHRLVLVPLPGLGDAAALELRRTRSSRP